VLPSPYQAARKRKSLRPTRRCLSSREPEQDAAGSACANGSPILAWRRVSTSFGLPHLTGFEPLWHQTETVRKVLKQFRGRVLLADEVGLGKTIEACMVLKEYALRGMAERTLVLTPASLVGRWHEELERKFGLAFATT
jgi:SNF2 family DNA or RNA helicase